MNPQQKRKVEFGRLTLNPGARYRVTREFQDYDSKFHNVGEEWDFIGYDFFPYDAGYTFYVALKRGSESAFRMQEHPDAQERLLADLHSYIEQVQLGAPGDGFAAPEPRR